MTMTTTTMMMMMIVIVMLMTMTMVIKAPENLIKTFENGIKSGVLKTASFSKRSISYVEYGNAGF